jgi:hypothetical protein
MPDVAGSILARLLQYIERGRNDSSITAEGNMRLVQCLFLILALAIISTIGHTQPRDVVPSTQIGKRQTLTLSFGAGVPHSRTGLTTFWNAGPSGSVKFMVNVNRVVAFGIGVDAAMLNFNESAFRFAYPMVPIQSKDMVMASVYLAMKCVLLPSMRVSPYVGMTLGATHASEAIYGDVIDSVRVNYYSLPARTRLTIGLALGGDIYITRWLAVELEGKINYLHHDPDFGITSFVRGGFRFTL